MPKKKLGKHLQFYIDCIRKGEMPKAGLCACSWNNYICEELLMLFKPDGVSAFSYWASNKKGYSDCYVLTELRQTIVLFMAAIAGEL